METTWDGMTVEDEPGWLEARQTAPVEGLTGGGRRSGRHARVIKARQRDGGGDWLTCACVILAGEMLVLSSRSIRACHTQPLSAAPPKAFQWAAAPGHKAMRCILAATTLKA